MRLGPRFHPPFRAAGRVRFLHEPRHLAPSHGSADRAKAGGRPPVSLKAHCDTATPRRVHAVPGGSSLTAGSVGELRQRPSCPRTRGSCPPARCGQVRRPRIHVETWGRTWTRKRRRHLGGPRAGTDVSCRLGSDLPRRGDEEASAWISRPPARFLQTSPVDGSGPCSAVVTVGSAGSPRGPFFLVRAAGGPADPVGRVSKGASVCFARRCGVPGPAWPRLHLCDFGYAQSAAVQED